MKSSMNDVSQRPFLRINFIMQTLFSFFNKDNEKSIFKRHRRHLAAVRRPACLGFRGRGGLCWPEREQAGRPIFS